MRAGLSLLDEPRLELQLECAAVHMTVEHRLVVIADRDEELMHVGGGVDPLDGRAAGQHYSSEGGGENNTHDRISHGGGASGADLIIVEMNRG